jgi:farnesyl diphosphate synthase
MININIFENYLKNNLPKAESFHPYFEKALAHMLLSGGKRFRPQLLLSVVDGIYPMFLQNAMPVALALEILHTYSLIHDDLPAMDNSPLRRGTPTIHTVWNDSTAILVGDGLNTLAFEIITKAPLRDDIKVKLIRNLSESGGINGMVLGQAIDLQFEKTPISLDQLKFLHIHKTGKLIASALKMGAIITDKSNLEEPLWNLGIELGLLFQIQDDILDVTSNELEAGKPINWDGNKNSFVNLLGLHNAKIEADKYAIKIESNLDIFEENLKNSLKNILSQYLKRHNN